MGSLSSSRPGGPTADSTSSFASCDCAFVSVFAVLPSMIGGDGGTSTLPVCCSVASDFGDAGLKIFVLVCDCGAVASILLGPVCGETG